MARKKQHLRYQAKKGRLQTTTSSDDASQSESDIAPQKQGVSTSEVKKKSPQKAKAEFTKLPESETRFVRKEIVYISFIALFLLILYTIIFLIFRFTGVDEWLSELVRLKN